MLLLAKTTTREREAELDKRWSFVGKKTNRHQNERDQKLYSVSYFVVSLT